MWRDFFCGSVELPSQLHNTTHKMISLFLFVSILFTSSFALSNQKALSLFRDWKVKFNKTYQSTQEESTRYSNFLASLIRVQKRPQAAPGAAKFGLTKFSDLSVEEFRSTILMRNKITPDKTHPGPPKTNALPNSFPKAFDWKSKGVVTAVKDQEQCGSCWAFSATETLESAWMIKNNITNTTMKALAPQQLVDCTEFSNGCGGGQPVAAYHYLLGCGGQETNADYPYQAANGQCQFSPSKVYAKLSKWNFACYPEEEQELMQSSWNHGPVSICVDAANWQDYQSGVMTGWQCAYINLLDHCVQATGWDLTGSIPYWNVRNSWNTDWGEDGYIRLEYGQNTCGLTFMSTYLTAA